MSSRERCCIALKKEDEDMGKKALAIANLDTEKLIRMLNEALAEEWLAY